MGRGDRKTRKGKVWRGTNGKYRLKPRKRSKTMKNARPSAAATA